jgi:hypothetical protein
MKGLIVSRKHLSLIKQGLTRRLIKKPGNGEWSKVFEEPINVNQQQKNQVIDAVNAKFGPQFGWKRIIQFNKS